VDAEPAADLFLDLGELPRKARTALGAKVEGGGGQRKKKGACELTSMNHEMKAPEREATFGDPRRPHKR
jgi:hypothetical protein